MVTEGGGERKGRRTDETRGADERPGRRALFTPATPPVRKARAASGPPVEEEEPPVPGPTPAELAETVRRGADDLVPLEPGVLGEAYAPLFAAVNGLIGELTSTRSRLERAADDAARAARLEAQLAAATARPSASVRDLPLPALLAGTDLTVREANAGFLALVAVSADALAGSPVARFVRRRDGDPPVLAVRRKAPTRADVTLALPAGEARFAEHVSPVTGDSGDVEGLVIVYVPEEAPPEPEDDGYARLFSALMQEAPLSIALLDASFRVLDHTPALEALLGRDTAWLSAHPLTDLPLLEETGQGFEEIVDGGEEAFGEVLIEVGSTRRRLERYVLPVRDAEGRLFRLLVTFTDVTEGLAQADRIAALEQGAADEKRDAEARLAEIEGRAADRIRSAEASAASIRERAAQEKRDAETRIAALEEQAAERQQEVEESIAALQLALARLAEGDLRHRLDLTGQDPFPAVRASYNLAAEALLQRIETIEATAVDPIPAPAVEIASPDSDDGAALMSAAEIAGLLLGALAGERGERLLLDENDPLMPLRAEVNESLDRLESAWSEPAPSGTGAGHPDERTLEVEPPLPPADRPANAPTESLDAAYELGEDPAEEISIPDMIIETEPFVPAAAPRPLATPKEDSTALQTESEPSEIGEHRHSPPGLDADVEVVTFEMAGQQYALDIRLAREIVEMIPITPIPRSPPHITGIINLRGEITTILNLYQLLGLPDTGTGEGQKIVVLVPEAAEGSNVGIIVDNVHSVNQIPASRIELKGEDSSADYTGFVRGIIRQESTESGEKNRNLIIWIDMPAILERLIAQSP